MCWFHSMIMATLQYDPESGEREAISRQFAFVSTESIVYWTEFVRICHFDLFAHRQVNYTGSKILWPPGRPDAVVQRLARPTIESSDLTVGLFYFPTPRGLELLPPTCGAKSGVSLSV